MTWFDIAANDAVTFTELQSSGLTLKVGQSAITSTVCATKEELIAKYVVKETTQTLVDKANNELVEKKDCIAVNTVLPDCGYPTACHFNLPSNYGIFGSVFYKTGLYNSDGTWNYSNDLAKPTLLTNNTAIGFNANSFHVTTIPSSSPWINANGTTAINSRLNQSGIWKCGDQGFQGDVGFRQEITIGTAKVYYIGIGCDDYGSIKLNGTLIIQQSIAATGGTDYFNNTNNNQLFRYWHVYPVTLLVGTSVIEMTGTNIGGPGILGLEIYDATESQLVGCTSASGTLGDQSLSSTNLNKYIVFSSINATNGAASDIEYCECPPGYIKSVVDGMTICVEDNSSSL